MYIVRTIVLAVLSVVLVVKALYRYGCMLVVCHWVFVLASSPCVYGTVTVCAIRPIIPRVPMWRALIQVLSVMDNRRGQCTCVNVRLRHLCLYLLSILRFRSRCALNRVDIWSE